MCILSLSENDIEASGVDSLVHNLKHCTKLQELRYCNMVITGTAMSYNNSYFNLSLSFNNINETAASFLIEGFMHWTKLHKLE